MAIQISKESLLEEIQELAKTLGRPPKAKEYKRARLAIYRFGSWNNFLEVAGLKIVYHHERHTDEFLLEEVKKEASRIKGTPYMWNFRYGQVAAARFGSWNNFIRKAELSPNRVKHSSDYLIQSIRELSVKLGKIPARSDYPLAANVYYKFGSWNNFLIASELLSPENRCTFCGKEVKRKGNKFCSRKCYTKSKQNIKECVVCGKSFAEPPSSEKVCCSPSCGKKHRQQLQLTGAYDKANQKWLAEKEKYFADHKAEKHPNAKYWKIKSPTGKTYETVNLKEFIRQNIELFDGSTVRQAFDGIVKIKSSEQGKRKRPVKSYKGWTLLDWKD